MAEKDDPDYQPVPYIHADFPFGSQVFIDPSIVSIRPLQRGLGQIGTVCASVYYPFLERSAPRPYSTYVPIRLPDGQIALVEEEYVRLYPPQAK